MDSLHFIMLLISELIEGYLIFNFGGDSNYLLLERSLISSPLILFFSPR